MNRSTTTGDVNVIALVKGRERYVLQYEDRMTRRALRQLGVWAADPELSFNWYDAAVMAKRMRKGETSR